MVFLNVMQWLGRGARKVSNFKASVYDRNYVHPVVRFCITSVCPVNTCQPISFVCFLYDYERSHQEGIVYELNHFALTHGGTTGVRVKV